MTISRFLIAIIAPAAFHFIIGNIIEPKLLGKSLDINPVTVLVSLVFWGGVWGIPGAVISVPLTGIIKLYCACIDHPFFKVFYHSFIFFFS